MSVTRIIVEAPADAVFDVLVDPHCYPRWVVGASRIRDIDAGWPNEGSSFHHSVGIWPLQIHDSTTLVRAERPRSVELRARAWPLGEADVRIELDQRGDLTRVTIHEVAAEGPGAAIWSAPTAALTTVRNRLSLRRLKELVESGAGARAA